MWGIEKEPDITHMPHATEKQQGQREGASMGSAKEDPRTPSDLSWFLVGMSHQGYAGIHSHNPGLEMSLIMGDLFGELKALHEIFSPANKMEQ